MAANLSPDQLAWMRNKLYRTATSGSGAVAPGQAFGARDLNQTADNGDTFHTSYDQLNGGMGAEGGGGIGAQWTPTGYLRDKIAGHNSVGDTQEMYDLYGQYIKDGVIPPDTTMQQFLTAAAMMAPGFAAGVSPGINAALSFGTNPVMGAGAAGGGAGAVVGGPMSVGGAAGTDLAPLSAAGGTGAAGGTTAAGGALQGSSAGMAAPAGLGAGTGAAGAGTGILEGTSAGMTAPAGLGATAAAGAGGGAGGGGGIWDTVAKYAGPAAAVVGGVMGAGAAKDAADAQVKSAADANQLARDVLNKQIELNDPYRQAGLGAQNRMMTLLGLTPGPAATSLDGKPVAGGQAQGDPTDPAYGSLMKDFSMADYQADPGYAFRLSEGQKALDNTAAARGGLLAGRAAKDMTAYTQGQASQEYGGAYNRYQTNRSNKLNALQSVMGAGQTATGQVNADAGNYGATAGGNITGAGNAKAAGIVGGANAVTNAIGQGYGMYQNNNLMNMLQRPGGGYGY